MPLSLRSPIKQRSKANTTSEVSVTLIRSVIVEGVLLNPVMIHIFELQSAAYNFSFLLSELSKNLSAVTDMISVVWLFQALRTCRV